jgi:hypothetical protein
LALVNVGGRPGVVRSVGLQIKSDGGSMPPIDLSPERIDENPIVESGKTATISYIHRVSGVATPKFELPSGAQCHYVVSVSGDDFSRATVPSTAQCECPRH